MSDFIIDISTEELSKLAEIELTYKKKRKTTIKVSTSKQAERIFRYIWHEDFDVRERFYALFLNRAGNVMSTLEISSGGVIGTVVDVRLVVGPAIKMLCSSIIIAHNHPSNNKKPSEQDISLTKKIKEAAKLFDIALIDHIILCDNEYYSFADEGII